MFVYVTYIYYCHEAILSVLFLVALAIVVVSILLLLLLAVVPVVGREAAHREAIVLRVIIYYYYHYYYYFNNRDSNSNNANTNNAMVLRVGVLVGLAGPRLPAVQLQVPFDELQRPYVDYIYSIYMYIYTHV